MGCSSPREPDQDDQPIPASSACGGPQSSRRVTLRDRQPVHPPARSSSPGVKTAASSTRVKKCSPRARRDVVHTAQGSNEGASLPGILQSPRGPSDSWEPESARDPFLRPSAGPGRLQRPRVPRAATVCAAYLCDSHAESGRRGRARAAAGCWAGLGTARSGGRWLMSAAAEHL